MEIKKDSLEIYLTYITKIISVISESTFVLRLLVDKIDDKIKEKKMMKCKNCNFPLITYPI